MIRSLALALSLLASTARAATWHVDARNAGAESGTTLAPFRTVGGALGVAQNGDTVKVAEGTYNESVAIAGKVVILQGGFPGGSAGSYAGSLGGNFTDRDIGTFVSHLIGTSGVSVVTCTDCQASLIEGFTISGGKHGVLVTGDNLGSNEATVAYNIIENNGDTMPLTLGGGIYADGADVTVYGNTIRDNHAGRGGGIATLHGAILIEANTIEDNIGHDDHGGGLYLASTGIVSGNLIRHNEIGSGLTYGWGGGVLAYELGTDLLFQFNRVTDNYAPSDGGGVFIDDQAIAVLANELIDHNRVAATGTGGVGIYVDGLDATHGSQVTIRNSTIADNSTPVVVGGNGVFAQQASTVAIKNTIFWGNNGDDFYTDANSTITMTYSTSQEALAGTGNLTSDPLFAGANDYHPKSQYGRWTGSAWVFDATTSPTIDTGDPASPFFQELESNGDRVNQGNYGNTAEASASAPGIVQPDMASPSDLSVVADLSIAADLHAPDLSHPDLSHPDLSHPDLAGPVDMTKPWDFQLGADLARPADLAPRPDLSASDGPGGGGGGGCACNASGVPDAGVFAPLLVLALLRLRRGRKTPLGL